MEASIDTPVSEYQRFDDFVNDPEKPLCLKLDGLAGALIGSRTEPPMIDPRGGYAWFNKITKAHPMMKEYLLGFNLGFPIIDPHMLIGLSWRIQGGPHYKIPENFSISGNRPDTLQ